MSWATRLIRSASVLICGLALWGCMPSSRSVLDEEREPHFLAGKARVNSMDYKGAIDSFEKALEVNPQSASAHLELGLLYEKDEMDCAAAIYHFDRFLRLRPDADNAEVIKQHIVACKQELAKTVSLGPVTQGMQREFDQLAEENRRWRDEVEKLRGEVEKWRSYYNTNRGGISTRSPAGGTTTARAAPVPASSGPQAAAASQTSSPPASRSPGASATAGRTYKVQQGDTPASIARRYGVKLDALMSANPGVNPTRLQIGQSLNIPGP